ncbi:MAG: creatininase family protein [Deltaproteobacteria bacterium]|nr:creatininase family protein [Deltaproteobacteria bacterium]
MDVVSVLDLPHREARRLLAGGPVFLGVNPVEFHGPHLSLHNDAWISLGLAKETASSLGLPHLLWAGDLEMGVDPCPGPGSRHVPTRVVTGAVVDAVDRLFELGARRLVLMTFHGAPLHAWALHEGVEAFRRRGGRALQPLSLVFEALFTLDREELRGAVADVDEGARERLLDEIAWDFHAGFFETSLALRYAKDTVAPSYVDVPPCPPLPPDALFVRLAKMARSMGKTRLAAEFDLAGLGRGWSALRPFPGYTGQPARASTSAGAFFARVIVERYSAACRAVLNDGAEPPPPIMSWLRTITLNGRLPTGHVDVADVTG